MMSNLNDTLNERGNRYGKFDQHAEITQAIKSILRGEIPTLKDETKEKLARVYAALAPDQKEALEMTAHKIGRILNGNPNYSDSWHDIAGYNKLVTDRLEDDLSISNLAGLRIPAHVHSTVPAEPVPGKAETENGKSSFGTGSRAVRGGQRASAATGKRTRK